MEKYEEIVCLNACTHNRSRYKVSFYVFTEFNCLSNMNRIFTNVKLAQILPGTSSKLLAHPWRTKVLWFLVELSLLIGCFCWWHNHWSGCCHTIFKSDGYKFTILIKLGGLFCYSQRLTACLTIAYCVCHHAILCYYVLLHDPCRKSCTSLCA